MNNDLEQFSEERLKYLSTTSSIKNGATVQESAALARIALAAKQAKPIGWMDTCELFDLQHGYTSKILPKKEMNNDIPLYTTTPPPHTEQGNQVEVLQFIINNPEKDGYFEWADCNQDYFNSAPKDHRRVLYTTPQQAYTEQETTEWTNDQCLEFLQVAFRHNTIDGEIEFDDIRLGVKFALAADPKPESE